ALYAVGAPDNNRVLWQYLTCTRTSPASPVTSGSCTFTMPATPGQYEVRLFANDYYNFLARTAQITVAASSPQVTASTTSLAPGRSEERRVGKKVVAGTRALAPGER